SQEDPRLRALLLAFFWLIATALSATAYSWPDDPPPLADRVTPEVLTRIFSEATRVEPLDDGGPPAMAAYVDDRLAGYVFSTLDVLRAPGYSSTPFDIVAGVTLGGRITGAAALFHREPYILD